MLMNISKGLAHARLFLMQKISKGEDNMAIKPVSGEIKSQDINDNLSYLESKTNNISKGAPAGTYTTVALLTAAYPSGNTNIYVVTSTGNWHYWSGSVWAIGGKYQEAGIALEQIDTVNLGGLVRGKNIFNKDSALIGYHINRTTGELISNTTSYASDYILVETGTSYTWSSNDTYIINIAYFTDLGVFSSGDQITADEVNKTRQVPQNARLMRFSLNINQLESTQVEKGIAATNYEAFYQYNPNLKRQNEGLITESSQLTNQVVTTDKLGDLLTGKNRFNPFKVIKGYYLNSQAGILVENPEYFTSDYINFEVGQSIVISPNINYLVINYIEYDVYNNITFTQQVRPGDSQVFTPKAKSVKFRFSAALIYLNTFQVEKGTIATDYEAFYQYNPNLILPPKPIDETSAYRPLILQKDANSRIVINIPSITAADEFIQYELSHTLIPFTTGATGQNADLWRISGCNFVRLNLDSLSPVFVEQITNKGAWECAIQAEGYADFIGTLHGYELMDSIKVYVDGVSVDMSTNFTKTAEEIKVIYKARLIRQGTEADVVANILRVYTFNQQDLQLKQQYKWVGEFDKIENGYITMLPILRNIDYTDLSSKLITDTAYSDKDWIEYDVSDKTIVEPINQRHDKVFMCHIFGQTSRYAATVSVKYKDETKSNRFYVSNNDYYNKFYFSYWYDTPIVIGDVWDIETTYKIKKSE